MASTSQHTYRHKSGHSIVKHDGSWSVMSKDGNQVLKRVGSLDEAIAWCDAKFVKVARCLHLLGATGDIRTAKFEDRDHVVVPVVALLGDTTIWPVNAPAPEYVPAETLAVAPQGWNGRPCVGDHPQDNGTQISANSPRILEREAFGRIFDAQFKNNSLAVEGWLDRSRADALPEPQRTNALDVLDRVLAGEVVEVSVGCYVVTEEHPGIDANGMAYNEIWTEVVPDHLAFLPAGSTGACSVEMGCGAPRAARIHIPAGDHYVDGASAVSDPTSIAAGREASAVLAILRSVTAHVPETTAAPVPDPAQVPQEDAMSGTKKGSEDLPQPKSTMKTMLARFASSFVSFFRSAQEGMSDADLRGKLYDAVRADEPGFLWIEEVYPTDSIVIYCVQPEQEMQTIRRTFALSESGDVTLNGDREEVERVTSYQPKAAAASAASGVVAGDPAPKTAACGCGGQKESQTPAHTAAAEVKMHRNAERISALIANPKTYWKAADQTFLEGLDDARLSEVEAAAVPPTETEEERRRREAAAVAGTGTETPAATTTEQPKAAAAKKTTAEWLSDAPAEVRSLVANAQRQEQARRTALVGSLKGCQSEYTEAELGSMPIDQLERIARLARATVPDADFAALGGPAREAVDDFIENPPNGWFPAGKAAN
jgi:hypothetical protein